MRTESKSFGVVNQPLSIHTAPREACSESITRNEPHTFRPDIIADCGNPDNFVALQKSVLLAIQKSRPEGREDLLRLSPDAPYLIEAIPEAVESSTNGVWSSGQVSTLIESEKLLEVNIPRMPVAGNRPEEGGDRRSGGTLDNIPPQKSTLCHFTGSIDWLEVSNYVEFNPVKYAELLKKLEDGQSWARIDPDDLPEDEKFLTERQYLMLCGQRVKVLPHGVRKGMWCPYVIEAEHGYKIIFNGRSSVHKTMPNVYVEITGKICLFHGALEMLEDARKFIVSIGGEIVKEKLSRIDEALDMPGVSMSEFEDDFKNGSYITLGKKTSVIKSTGLTLGVGSVPLQIRIYDKLAKVKASGDCMEQLFLQHRRWSGVEPESASRVEFQINREHLKVFGVDTVEDYFRLRSDIVKYLVYEWFRFIVPETLKNNHYSKAITSPLWSKIQQGFMLSVGAVSGLPLIPVPKSEVDLQQIVAQINGLIEKCLVIHEITSLHPMIRGYYAEVALQKFRCVGNVVFSEMALKSFVEMSENSQRMFTERSQQIAQNFLGLTK